MTNKSTEDLISDTNNTIVKAKRGRKPKNVVIKNSVIASENDHLTSDSNPSENIELQITNDTTNLGGQSEDVLVFKSIEDNLVNDTKEEDKDQSEQKDNEDNDNINENTKIQNDPVQQTQGKKRGRKPKGGKITQQAPVSSIVKESRPNIILHLKCCMKDLNSQNQNNGTTTIESYHFSNSKNDLTYDIIHSSSSVQNTSNVDVNKNIQSIQDNKFYCENVSSNNHHYSDDYDEYDYNSDNEDNKSSNTKQVWKKLKSLEHNLHINNINDKKSACFWCTYDFDNPPVYIPKYYMKESYHVYGCFCSPECGVAFLMEENIDSSTKFERYHLLNHIYAKIYDYKNNIKPAPNVYYMLDKYYGNLTIQEYRSLLRNERFFLVVDKPLTRVLPELHEDNDDFILNNKIIPSNTYQVKKKLIKKSQNKTTILNEKFGMNSNL